MEISDCQRRRLTLDKNPLQLGQTLLFHTWTKPGQGKLFVLFLFLYLFAYMTFMPLCTW